MAEQFTGSYSVIPARKFMRLLQRFRTLLLLTLCISAVRMQADGIETCSAQDVDNAAQPRQLLQLMRETQDAISAAKWLQAAEQFDAAWDLVCRGEDPLMIGTAGDLQQLIPGNSATSAGGRAQLEQLYLDAPADFRKEYQRQFRDLAEQRVAEALRRGDLSSLKLHSIRYRFLPAAATAAKIIARIAIERDDLLEATLHLDRLRRFDGAPTPELQLQIAVTAWSAGLDADAVDIIRQLMSSTGPGTEVKSGRRSVRLPTPTEDISGWLETLSGHASRAVVPAWAQPGGNYRRTRSQSEAITGLKVSWVQDAFSVADVLFQDQLNPVLRESAQLLQRVTSQSDREQSTLIPAVSPLVIDDLLIFRTIAGALRAVDRHSGAIVWETTHYDARFRSMAEQARGTKNGDGDPLSESDQAESVPGADMNAQLQPEYLRRIAREQFYQLLRTNPAGQISSDRRTIYVCEDCSAVTWTDVFDGQPGTAERLPANFLRAYSAKSGKFLWEAGGQRASDIRVNTLAGFYFLGAPLVLGSRIYVLAESGEGLFLLQIGPPTGETGSAARNPVILHSQLLANPQYKLTEHPVRRHAGLIPTYSQGLLICPTCDEHIVAVSADDHTVRWAYRYQGIVRVPDLGGDAPVLAGALNSEHSLAVDLDTRWTDTLPRVVDNRVIVTPRDADELYCLDLQTGRELWRVPRGLARSIAAVTSDLVVLNGNKTLTALRLTDGSTVWMNDIRNGHVSGTVATDGNILQVPTSASAILLYELRTGRLLLSEQLPEKSRPGNLVTVDGQIFSQDLTSVRAFSRKGPDAPDTTQDQAHRLLLARNDTAAIDLLSAELLKNPNADSVRELLLDVLLESLRVDFPRNSQHIPRIRELISQTAVSDPQVLQLLLSTLGMNISDAAVMPNQLEAIDRSGQRMDHLLELIMRGLQQAGDLPAESIAVSIEELLPKIVAEDSRIVESGQLIRRHSRTIISGIRGVIESRSPEDQRKIHEALRLATDRMIADIGDDTDQLIQVVRSLDAAGLSEAAAALAESLIAGPNTPPATAALAVLQREQMTLRDLRRGDPQLPERLRVLWQNWTATNDLSSVRTMIHDLTSEDGSAEAATMKFSAPELSGIQDVAASWEKEHPDTSAELWDGAPRVTKSDDRTMQSAEKLVPRGPQRIVPLFGMPGIFRGWTFCQEFNSQDLVAFDNYGIRRWTFTPDLPVDSQQTGRINERYVMASGHLLAVKLQNALFMLDTTGASADVRPRLLWNMNVSPADQSSEVAGIQQFMAGFERVPLYAPLPEGLFPCGPLTADTIPVIVGRTLFMRDAISGQILWQIGGIAADSILLGTSESLLIMSKSSGQIESRSRLDGELLSISGIPEWWISANENVGASVRDIELESGLDILWRIATHGEHCLLFRQSVDKASLELRHLMTDAVVWNVHLPTDTVFSNVAEDMVAVLSNGNELRVFRIDTGTEVSSVNVTKVPEPRALYLRPSLNRLIVLPEAVDDPSLDLDPVSEGLPVYGRRYALDRKTMQLAWDEPLDHRAIRIPSGSNGIILPNSPVLVLLARTSVKRPTGASRATRYLAQVIDVSTGKEVYAAENIGIALYPHTMEINAAQHQLNLQFESFNVLLDYGSAGQ